MKIRSIAAAVAIPAVIACIVISACTKDTGYRTVKVYTPVYKSITDVTASVKTSEPEGVTASGKMLLLGKYIFLNEVNKGIHIIDNSNPAAPVNKAFINIPGNLDIATKGNTLYADCYTYLLVLDISDLQNVSCKTYLHNVFPDRASVLGTTIPDGQVIVDWKTREATENVSVMPGQGIWKNHEYYYNGPWYDLYAGAPQSNAYNLASSGKSNTGIAGSSARMAIINNHLYTAASNVLSAINIATPSAPKMESQNATGISAQSIFPFNNKLFIGGSNGVSVFSTDNASAPLLEGGFGHFCSGDPVIADENTAYVTLHTGNWCNGAIDELDVLDVSDLHNLKTIRNYPLTSPKGLSKDGNLLFVCDGPALKVFNAANPADIKLLQTINLADTYDVICHNKIAYVSAKGGLYQFDYSDTRNIKQLGKISLPQ
ncbi:MAG TPA: hypothetical protein VHB48_03145 [Chitinophagaceae bacterium]|nr:hypothetical protein [Chitinophagaceae bacterium]